MNILERLNEVKSDSSSPAATQLQELLTEASSLSSSSSTNTTITITPLQYCNKVHEAINVICRSILLYPPRDSTSTTNNTTEKRQRIALSFNGGKDCTVVLHLLLAALATTNDDGSNSSSSSTTTTTTTTTATATTTTNSNSLINHILPFYFSTPDVFQEELDFVRKTAKEFFNGENNLLTIPNVSNEAGVTVLVEQYGIKAFLMGTRSTDPDGQWLNGVFWPSSKGWCPFMRINPCLHWSYNEVWIFLRFFNIEYCSLYDDGYTSIGTKSTSKPNPMLKSKHKFHPAYMLADGTKERAGRMKKRK